MNQKFIPIAAIASPDAGRQRKREAPRGRQVDAAALAEVQALLGDAPRRRDLLIEHLHRINDRFGRLSAQHLAALAQEMRLAQTEVYEVASFYHHFEVVKEAADGTLSAAPALTVRVCDGLTCEIAGAQSLLARLPLLLGREVHVIPAPCVGRCEQAPVAVIGQKPLAQASGDTVVAAIAANATQDIVSGHIGYAEYRQQDGYRLLRECVSGARDL
ncbi:MAG: NAD(P)H-dependent oxidoreductase subunit E, partial [Noviherbaspirillum sp.]